MLWAYLKIGVTLAIPISAAIYARQLRRERDIQALIWVVQHSPSLQWAIDHPREAAHRNVEEARYIRFLMREIDD
jgi:hypothetical protein